MREDQRFLVLVLRMRQCWLFLLVEILEVIAVSQIAE